MQKSILLSEERIFNRIYFIREKKVMLDKDLAEMYGVVTGNLNKAVKRNLRRFPDDFMFQLTAKEFENLKSRSVPSSSGSNPESQPGSQGSNEDSSNLIFQFGISSGKRVWGGTRSLPYVFTEQGIAMLSSVLGSDTAIDVNIQIIRVFTRIREVLLDRKDVDLKIEKLEKLVLGHGAWIKKHDDEINDILIALRQFININSIPVEKVGYKRKNEE